MDNKLGISKELIIDNFAGGGGASTGIELALGRPIDIAINHDADAIAMHKINHPRTKHYCESVYDVDPMEATQGRPVALCWLSPDCTHFSKAKGGKPVKKEIRGLAWIALRWAAAVRPRVIMLENVEEFKTWGPLKVLRDSKTKRIIKINGEVARKGEVVPFEEQQLVPDKKKAGKTFLQFKKALEKLGYKVKYKELKACDYGAPTTRKRFFLIARCDGKDIVFPKSTHAPQYSEDVRLGIKQPYRAAKNIIDWSIPTKSIFDRKKPLAEATLKRIARGIFKYVLNDPEPFILQIGQTGFTKDRNASIHEPLRTIVTKAEHCLITPTIMVNTSKHSGSHVEEPLKTITTGGHHSLVSAFVEKAYGGFYTGCGTDAKEPLSTITAVDHNRLCIANIKEINDNLETTKFQQVQSFLIKYYGQCDTQSLEEPLHTITSKDRFGLITVEGTEYQIVDIGLRMLEPHELYAGQGFPTDYQIDVGSHGKKITKTEKIKRVGNSVPPAFAEALVRANFPEHVIKNSIRTMKTLNKEFSLQR